MSTSPSDALRPWQFFTLLALVAATGAVFVVRGTPPSNIILICLAIGAAALVGVAALRTLRPLTAADIAEPEMVGNRTRAAIEREKNLVLRSIKELEFDHAMGKVSTQDYDDMTARLRARAVRLLQQLDSSDTGYREIIERELASRLGKAGLQAKPPIRIDGGEATAAAGTCTACDTVNDIDAKFCKQCGAKLIAMLLLVLFTCAGRVWAQGGFQMPDPRQMSGIPRPVSDLPDGHISVRLIRGQLSNNIPNFPVELHAGSKVVTVKTDENGRAEFSGVAAGTNVRAVATVDGERLESQEFPAPAEGGIRLLLVATLKGGAAAEPTHPPETGMVVFGDQSRIVFDMADDTLQVFYLLDVENSARAPVNPPKPIVLDMPKAAQGTALLGGPGPAVVSGNRVTLTGPFPPGQTAVQIGYQLPYSGGDVQVSQNLPVPTGGIAVLMKKIGAMSLASPQLPQVQEREFQGERYVLGQGPAQRAGSTLSLSISGLPHHSTAPRNTALIVALFLVGGGIWAATSAPRRSADAAAVKQLQTRREKLLSELVRLEQQRQAGQVDTARYKDRRPALIAQLERVYRDLDSRRLTA